jgi:hypothetical protein
MTSYGRPAGPFTVETKSHRGRVCVDPIDDGTLLQAYAQRKWLERVSRHDVEALLVSSAAWVDRPRSGVRGCSSCRAGCVRVTSARRQHALGANEPPAIHGRLALAVADEAAQAAGVPLT